MSKKVCPAGQKWDRLITTCVRSGPEPVQPVTQPAVPSPGRMADAPETLGPLLWTSVAVVATGSVLALVLWSIIYRRRCRRGNRSETPPPGAGADPLDIKVVIQTAPAHCVHRAATFPAADEPLARSPCPHRLIDGGATSCAGALWPGVTWSGEDGATCSALRKHRIPLPATELGDAALVTTKTV